MYSQLFSSVPELFDLELRLTVAKNDNISHVNIAAHNKWTQMTAICSSQPRLINVLDKNFEITHKIQDMKMTYCKQITWLDEFRFSMTDQYQVFKIADIRMPQDFIFEMQKPDTCKPITISNDYKMLSGSGNFTTDHILKVPNDNINLGYVWSLKDFTWHNVVVLPDDIKGQPMSNSRYVAFMTKGNEICLLDFASK